MSQPAAQGGGKTAFVLSGGGSLGAIQVGMLQALMEAGIRPDLLVGTSVGAVNAAWLAGQPDVQGALKLAEIWSGLRRRHIFPLNPWSGALGLVGRTTHVISNAGLRSVLEKNLPYTRLEQAAVPVHVLTTDLRNGRAVVLSSGPAVPALLASTAIPGVFPSVTIGRRELVDGGVSNHMPISAAIELGASRIFVLPIGYPWVRTQPGNALAMALHALARFVEQRLEAEVRARRDVAEIHMLPTIDAIAVSPADFSRTPELIRLAHRSTRRFLAGTARPPAIIKPAAMKLAGLPVRAA
ncbi:MAG: patatin-like phospholipase family protein [Candidatus Dormibacteraeota bacterium]|nr:patatin-like phospholipase family protein [Candidatus Dormibacteraeota bacterium]